MLGCVLYVLCTGNKHPFQDSPNLAILNAQYDMDETETNNLSNLSETIKDLIRAILVTNPAERLTLAELKDYLEQIQTNLQEDLGDENLMRIRMCPEAKQKKKRQNLRNEKLRKASSTHFAAPTPTTVNVKPSQAAAQAINDKQKFYSAESSSLDAVDGDCWWTEDAAANNEQSSDEDAFGDFK